MERLTRKIEKSSWRDRGRKPSGYTSDYTKQEVDRRLAAYEDIGTVEEFAALVQAESEGRIIPKEAHQPSFVKYDAIDIFDQWNDTTGVLDKGTSWYCEIQGVIEEVAAMAFGAGVIYQSEASAALAAKEAQE